MTFHGWSPAALNFYRGLESDNSRSYWDANKSTYEQSVVGPMRALLEELEPTYGPFKLFRPYRDIRFSTDKSPYKTAIGALLERGWYVQLSADGLAVGAGYHHMASDQLARYRDAVVDEGTGAQLAELLIALRRGHVDLYPGTTLKTVPRGYQADHERIDLLRRKDLAAWKQWAPAKWLATSGAKSHVESFFEASAPLVAWLESNVGPSSVRASR